jgi:hypothetical protein
MKKAILVLLLVCTAVMVYAQESLIIRKWSYNTAYVMPAGKWESGIFQSFRYGLNEKTEISTQALMLPFIPSVGIKRSLGSHGGFDLAGTHLLSVPTPFLNIVSRKGIGGLISPEYDFSFIASLASSLLVSRQLSPSLIATADAGFVFAVRGTKPDPQSTIDLPLFYPRMAHYYEGTSIRLGGAVKGSFARRWLYEEGARVFLITRSENNFFFENSGTLMWAVGKSLRIRGGYILAYGKYPYGSPAWQLWPTLDLVFGSR